ncbi:MAG: hypothetical protein WAQ05_02505, partial [Rubrivivax sp.]
MNGPGGLDDAQAARRAGADLLSLALIDARNHTLRWLALFEAQGALERRDAGPAALWLVAQGGVYQDLWIARHVQCQRGEGCDPRGLRLAPTDAAIDAWLGGASIPPTPERLRAWLADTLETTLELLGQLEHGGGDDVSLHFFRLALRREDRLAEALAERAIELQLPLGDLQTLLPLRPEREALW